MRRRGYVLALVLMLLAMISASVVVFSNRIAVDINARADDGVRSQALWLARSALHTSQRGAQTISTAHGEATVTVSAGEATVELERVTVRITAAPWTERVTWK